MKQSFSNYFKEDKGKCAPPFCIQRALAARGHSCFSADKHCNHLNQSFTVVADAKIFTQTPERSCQQMTTTFIKQLAPHVMLTPVRSKVSTPRGLAFDNDAESRDAWSVSMATPLSEQQQQGNLVELVDTGNCSTSGDESYSNLSNIEHSGSCRIEQDDMKGEVISQRFIVKQETENNDDCHRTPLTLVARKLFSKTESENLLASNSTPASPELISSSQEMTTHNSQEVVEVEETATTPVNQTVPSPTCSQDLFDNIDPAVQCDITPSQVTSSTPVTAAAVGQHKHDGLVTSGTKERDVIEGDVLVSNDGCVDNYNSDTAYCKLDFEVHSHTGDVELTDIRDCKPDTADQKCNTLCSNNISYHDNSDLMDELFANSLTNLTRDATDQLLQQEEQKLTHSKPIANHNEISGCGDDVMHNDAMDHMISKDDNCSTVTPIITANSFYNPTMHHTVRQTSSTSNNTGSVRKSTKQFKVPRMAKEVPEDEKKKLLEQYSKKFPSLVVNDNTKTPTSGNDVGYGGVVTDGVAGRMISCGFTSAGSGKKFTVSAAALQRAARLVEDFSTDLITDQYRPVSTGCHSNSTGTERSYREEQEAKSVNASAQAIKEKPFSSATKVEGLKDVENEPRENSVCVKEERSCDTIKKSHELVENYGLENIDMEQFSTFTQMPGYIRAVTSAADEVNDDDHQLSTATDKQISDAIWTPAQQSSVTPLQKEVVSSFITPGGSFNPCPANRSAYDGETTPCRQPTVDGHDDEELKRMFNTQLVKQFLDFSSSNEDEGDHMMTTNVEVVDQLSSTHNDNQFQNEDSSPTHNDEILPCARPCDTNNCTQNELCGNMVTKNNTVSDDHTLNMSHDTTSPIHNDITNPSVSIPHSAVFATASGKSVSVSTDAISSVKKLLDDKCRDDVNKAKPRAFPGLCTASGNKVNISDQSLQAVKLLFSDDKTTQGVTNTVANGNQSHGDSNCKGKADNDIEMMSLNEPYGAADVSSIQRSCDPIPELSVAMESAPASVIISDNKIAPAMKRRRDPLYTTPEAVLSDRAHPKRMCFTPLVTNSDSIVRTPSSTPTAVTMTTTKQTPKFMTPFKAHRMSSTPQQKSLTTPVHPVWRRGWKKLGMSSNAISFQYSNNNSISGNKSVNDSGIGSSLPDQPVTSVATTVEEQECIDKQFEVTDTQMESFFATQGSVSPIVNHHDNSVGDNGAVRPQRGTLSMMRSTTDQRISLTTMTGCVRPGRYSRHQLISLGVHPSVVDVTAATAVNFKFDVHHYFSQSVLHKGTVTVGDGVVLKLECHNDYVTKEQLQRAFFCSPGVDGNLINVEWFNNHYRWIVWKLASLEVSFPHSFAGKWLTPHWLLLHMKYRYDREVDLAHRSCIKKILERDDSPTKSMVLVITEICSHDNDDISDGSCDQTNAKDTICPTVMMSDGWYGIGVVMDTPLKHVVSTNQITVGCKLYISGAKLLGSCDPCPPLECPDSVMLKINANSTRRAHWNAKLGFQPCPLPFPVPMSSLYPDGGLVGCVHVTVVRSYPLQHMERTSDGNCVFRNQRKEEIVAKEYESRRQYCLEDISLQVHKEFEKELNEKSRKQCHRRRRSMSRAQITKLSDGQKIEAAMNSVPDPVEFEEQLTVTQKALLDSYRHGVLEEQRRELEQRMKMAVKESEDKLPPLRNVVPLLKVRITGHPSRLSEWTENVQSCMLTIWKPTDDIMSLLQEGVSLKLYHVMASSPHRYSSDHIQLATNRGTRFERLSKVDEDLLQLLYQPRKVTPLAHLASGHGNHSIDYGQVDIIGIIVTVVSSHITTANGTEKSVDKVYITDDDDNIIVVKIWDGIESLTSKDCVKAGRVACFINLSFKAWIDDDGIPTCSTSDLTIITIKPQEHYLKAIFQCLQKFIKSNPTVVKSLEERVAHLH